MFKQLAAATIATVIALAIAPAHATHIHGSGQPPEIIISNVKLSMIFVTSDEYTGDLVEAANLLGNNFPATQGLKAADAICQFHADASDPPLPDSGWVALLSSDKTHASKRINSLNGPFIRPDGAPIAPSWAALFSTNSELGCANGLLCSPLINAVDLDENGDLRDTLVWTGTIPQGRGTFENCSGWSSGDPTFGTNGLSTAVDGNWLNTSEPPCGDSRALYCVQLTQP